MRELLTAAAERAIRYLEGLNERGVAPDPTVFACLSELAIPLPAHPSPADETVALLDSYNAATMAMAGPRFFGFVIGRALPTTLAANELSSAWDQNAALAGVTLLTTKLEDVALVGSAMCLACRPKRVWGSSLARRWRISPAWPQRAIPS